MGDRPSTSNSPVAPTLPSLKGGGKLERSLLDVRDVGVELDILNVGLWRDAFLLHTGSVPKNITVQAVILLG